jgi:hypothetical protein
MIMKACNSRKSEFVFSTLKVIVVVVLWDLFRWSLGIPAFLKQTSGQLAISLISLPVIYIAVFVSVWIFQSRQK